MNRYIERDESAEKWDLTPTEKELQQVTSILINLMQNPLVTDYEQRWRTMLKSHSAVAFTAQTTSRCVVGLGAKGTREIGLRLHHVYGFPIIPGSALKGLARAWATFAVADQLGSANVGIDPSEILNIIQQGSDYKGNAAHKKRVLEGAEIKDLLYVFGAREGSGNVIFFDAIPTDPLKLEADIMNPHHPQYYDTHGAQSPADYESPIPIIFLTVAADCPFLFAVAPRHPSDAALLQTAETWLHEGLRTLGIGAKTTSGYGRFD
ncbi:MAG: type III-B CRISPR module RAMP protein Cmr6 [Chloroflexota bacterium]|nr:type III-B CRISPR module RAMP protein Cmr6 [Chloroflexota bacterium]